eukprot:6485309-Amphidinium_carterae.1
MACYKCWIKATGITEYQYADGRVSRLFRNMAQRTKPSDSNNKTKQWLNWRVKGKLQNVSAEQVQKLSMKYSGASDWVTSIGDGRVAVLYTCATQTCKAVPMRSSSWVLCKKSHGASQTQWHCPACGDKWTAGVGLNMRLLVVYGESDDKNACYRWGDHAANVTNWAEGVLDFLRKVELVQMIDNTKIDWLSVLQALKSLDQRNFRRLKQVMRPRWEKPVRPGQQWCEAVLHCNDPQLSVVNWAVEVPIGKLDHEPPPMTSEELMSLLNTCLAFVDPDSYMKNPTKKQKKVQFEADEQRRVLMPELARELRKLSLQQQGAQQ